MSRFQFQPSRRQLLAMSTLALWAPRAARAAGTTDRKFMFVFAQGGWDQTRLFAPLFDSSVVDMEAAAVEAEIGGVRFVDSEERPSVRSFLEKYADKTCFLNGFEVRSVAHDVCLRLMLTGTSLPSADDWPSILGAATGAELLLPVINLSGPSYTYDYGSAVVRVGSANQLPELIDGSALSRADRVLVAPAEDVQALEDAWVSATLLRRQAAASRGRAQEILARAVDAEARMASIAEASESLNFGSATTLVGGMNLLANAFSSGLARCGMVKHLGWQHLGWDSHADIAQQSRSFEELFGAVRQTCDAMQLLPGTSGGTLADETTIVVMSEMGRYPQLNARGGKEHWTFTSCVLIGAGVKGGQTIGGYDENSGGQKVDLSTGGVDAGGVSLVPDHVGATLLALADVDPETFLPGAEPITAVLV